MSLERRQQLIDQAVADDSKLTTFVREQPHDMLSGSWDLVSYSFQRGFEALWNLARRDLSGLLMRPLLLLWRQSVELSIKAAVSSIAGEVGDKPSHNLVALFDRLLDSRTLAGYCDNNDYMRSVRAMIEHVQSIDPFADRFRYPTTRRGEPFEGIAVELDELFQAHWLIVTWCEGAVFEVDRDRGWA